MRIIRELSLWCLFAHDTPRDGQKDPFERAQGDQAAWRNDKNLWKLYFNQIKPKERVISLWSNDEVWHKSASLIEGVLRHQSALDALISLSSLHWRLQRMGSIDRNILRLASYELCFRTDIPPRAVLNEAIELGKRYGSNDSGRFINGVLDRIAHDLGRVKGQGKSKRPTVQVLDITPSTQKSSSAREVKVMHTDRPKTS